MSNEAPPGAGPLDRPELRFEPGQPLPIFARRDGVDVVVISVTEYGELLQLRSRNTRETVAAAVQSIRTPPAGLSTIEKDDEVAAFLRDRFRGRESLQALRAACIAEFGKARAPSLGRLQTFRSRWRAYR